MSLQESGELERVDSFNFRVRGTSLISLEHLQEERNKERRSVRQAKMMLWLTVVLAIATSFQADLIKTSFYIDLDYVIDAISRSLLNWLINVIAGYMKIVVDEWIWPSG